VSELKELSVCDARAGCPAAVRDMELPGAISNITVPSLLICGAQDVSTPLGSHGDKIASAMAQTTVLALDTAHLADQGSCRVPGGRYPVLGEGLDGLSRVELYSL
jgi:hypothetical protein